MNHFKIGDKVELTEEVVMWSNGGKMWSNRGKMKTLPVGSLGTVVEVPSPFGDDCCVVKFADDFVHVSFSTIRLRKNFLKYHLPTVKRVIINEPATIIIWEDDTKTVVKCTEEDTFDPEKGIAMALIKHLIFNDSSTQMNKWMKKQTKEYFDKPDEFDCVADYIQAMTNMLRGLGDNNENSR